MYRLMLVLVVVAIIIQIPDPTSATLRATDRNFKAYLHRGCWKDEVNNGKRLIPSLEGASSFLDGHYKTRRNPVEKCMQAALQKGFEFFAVQDGGQCLGSANAKSNFKKAGRSTRCSNYGVANVALKGGPMVNDVYEINPLKKCLCLMPKNIAGALPTKNGKKICFKSELTTNGAKRTALHIAARYNKADCAKILIDAGANMEARDKDQKTPLQLAAWKKNCGPIKALVSARAKEDHLNENNKVNVKACSPVRPKAIAQKKVLPYEAVGCFKDGVARSIATLEGNPKVNKIITGHYKTRKSPVQKCYQAAKALKFKVFAVQDGGQCMSSVTALKTYKNYGKSEECVSEKGGPMANYVWKIKSA